MDDFPYHIDFNLPDSWGHYPIVSAINLDDPDCLLAVIEGGADVNLDTGDGWRPLHIAMDYAIDGMIQNNLDGPYPEAFQMLQILLEHGADISIKRNDQETPLDAINTYAGDREGFLHLKDMFRSLFPAIDELVQYIPRLPRDT